MSAQARLVLGIVLCGFSCRGHQDQWDQLASKGQRSVWGILCMLPGHTSEEDVSVLACSTPNPGFPAVCGAWPCFHLCFVPCSQSLLRHPSRGRCATSELVTFCSPGSPSLGSQEPLNLLSLLCRESRVSPVQPCPSYKMILVWFTCPAQLERRESLGPQASGCLGSR